MGLNAFLLKNGCDVASRAERLHQCARPVLVRVWGTARDSRLSEALHTYLRIQLRLGGIQARDLGTKLDLITVLMRAHECTSGTSLHCGAGCKLTRAVGSSLERTGERNGDMVCNQVDNTILLSTLCLLEHTPWPSMFHVTLQGR